MAPKTQKTSKTTSKKMTELAPIRSGSVRGEEVPISTTEATKNTVQLEDVLKANGEEHLYDKITELSVHVEDDPSVVFGWQNVEVFVEAIRAARAQANAPGGEALPADPLHLPAAVNVQTFKEAVVEYVRIPNAAARVETTCLPCTLGQLGQVGGRLQRLDLNAWTRRIIAIAALNMIPITCIYVPRPRSDTLDSAAEQFPNSLWA